MKSCVGSTWCRYGVQDSVGARHPHREPLQGPARAAQAQVGGVRLRARVRRGAGQGLRRHRHREGLEPLRLRQRRHEAAARASCSPPISTRTTLIRYIDRFLMFYIRTADRLQRTATWLNNLEGGIDYLRERDHRRLARASAPSSRPRWRTSSTPTSASGRRRSRIPRSCAQFRAVREHRRRPIPASCFVPERGQHRPGDLGGEGAARPGAGARWGGACERARSVARGPTGSTSARSTTSRPTPASRALVGDRQIAIVRVGDGDDADLRGRQLRSVQPRVRDRARHRRRPRRRPQDRVADLQAELRSRAPASASTTRTCGLPTYPTRVRDGRVAVCVTP